MMTSDDDGWVDKSGAEGRVESTRRGDERKRGGVRRARTRSTREVERKMYTYEYSRWCARRRREGRDESRAKNRRESPHHRTFATSGANLGEPIERGAPHSRFLFVRIDDNVEE